MRCDAMERPYSDPIACRTSSTAKMVRSGEDLDVLGVADLLGGVDVDKNVHWSLFSLRLPHGCLRSHEAGSVRLPRSITSQRRALIDAARWLADSSRLGEEIAPLSVNLTNVPIS